MIITPAVLNRLNRLATCTLFVPIFKFFAHKALVGNTTKLFGGGGSNDCFRYRDGVYINICTRGSVSLLSSLDRGLHRGREKLKM